jgi:hypothetical protein
LRFGNRKHARFIRIGEVAKRQRDGPNVSILKDMQTADRRADCGIAKRR